MAKITVIPAVKIKEEEKCVRVAAYVRVSTKDEIQAHSYELQTAYFTTYIKARPDWIFAGIYADDGISGTSTKARSGFSAMMDDALDGKIDLIVAKSISRFARNTVDSLEAIRKLKSGGVGVYFEKENVCTLDAKGELMITIMACLAQEESRSLSENIAWGKRKLMAAGKVYIPYSRMLGFDKDEAGNIVVDPEEAKVVRMIYTWFLAGMNIYSIARRLTEKRIKSPGGSGKWYSSTVRSILTNEKYKGDALGQKVFTVDFLQHKMKQNEGELPQYYVTDHHERIIEPEIFDLAQTRLKHR